MKITMTVEGVRQVRRALRELDRASGGEIRGAVRETVYRVRDRAKALAPVGTHDEHHHPRGQLRDGITGEMMGEDSLWGRAGVPKEHPAAAYAPIVEFGDRGRNKPARPYLWPAAEAERPQHRRRIAAAIVRAIRKVARGAR